MRLAAAFIAALFLPIGALAQAPAASYIGRTVTAIDVTVEGRRESDPAVAELIENTVGQPLSMNDVRDSMAHLYSLGRFQDVQVDAESVEGGVRLRYNLIPVHAVTRIEFVGELGLSDATLRRAVIDRFGGVPPVSRLRDVTRVLNQLYAERGYLRPSVTPRTTELHDPDRTVVTFDIVSGPKARVGRVEVLGNPLEAEAAFLRRVGATAGSPYEPADIQNELNDYIERLKDQQRYEAIATMRAPRLSEDGTTVDLTFDVQPGPVVTIAFAGDPIPKDRWDDLVPVEREGAVDEDLLEDSVRRIEDYLRQQGYWRARASLARQPSDGRLTILFTVTRGLQYRIVKDVEITGHRAIALVEIRPLAQRLGANELYVESNLTSAVAAIAGLYRSRGYAQVKVDFGETEVDAGRPGEGRVQPVIRITEGPLTAVGAVTFSGNASISAAELQSVARLTQGAPFVAQDVAEAQNRVLLQYLDLGYASVNVSVAPKLSEDGTRIDLEFRIVEGPQTIVDHIIIVGNRRTDPQVIRRELRLQTGQPLGLDERLESQRRVGALGLFRRVSVQALSHGDAQRQDVLVTVEEAPPTTIGYGGGIEVNRLISGTSPTGEAEERIDIAPRGSFDIGRRNLGGKNRSANLFTRFAVRPDDDPEDPEGRGSQFGFLDYRVVATYRQPRLLGANDSTIAGAVEQGKRTSFNFARKGVTAEVIRILAPGMRLSARYSFGTTKTFDLKQNEEDPTRIDRLFPQVRLSSFSSAISRDTRDDVVAPTRGTFISAEGSLAARALGGSVGFMKTYVQGFWFRPAPIRPGAVFAGRLAVGLADGFQRVVPDQDLVVDDLPASERFFAGGDTTIRGFALDTVGEPATFSGVFPQGGNAVTIFNAELRVPVWNDFGAVVFLDGGNVFKRVTNFDFTELRGAVGFGVRYRSPVGPIRVDLGFKLDPRIGEKRRAIHLSIGHAF